MKSMLFASLTMSLALSVPSVAVAKDAAAPKKEESKKEAPKKDSTTGGSADAYKTRGTTGQ